MTQIPKALVNETNASQVRFGPGGKSTDDPNSSVEGEGDFPESYHVIHVRSSNIFLAATWTGWDPTGSSDPTGPLCSKRRSKPKPKRPFM